MTEQKLPDIPGELSEEELRLATGGADAADEAEKTILALYSQAETSGWKKIEFLNAAQETLSAAKGLSSAEIARLNSLILMLAGQLPA